MHYVIIGDGAAGTTAAERLRVLDPAAPISVISDDPQPSYYRAALTNYLMGELSEDKLWAIPPGFFSQLNIQRIPGHVSGLDSSRRAIALHSGGAPLAYDRLLLATGARARPAPFEGAALAGVMTLRTLDDARLIMQQITPPAGGRAPVTRAVVVGGGPLALEWALGMHVRGVKVTLMIRGGTFMPTVLDAVASDLLAARLEQAGLTVRFNDQVAGAVGSPTGAVAGVVSKSRGDTLPCEMLAVGIGVVPNTEYLVGSGVELGPRGMVVVNDHLETTAPGVYAAGDLIEFGGRSLQLWEPAQRQGHIVAENMAGGKTAYTPGAHYMATRLFDLDFASVGTVDPKESERVLVAYPQGTGRISYRKIFLSGGKLVGALMLGHQSERVRQNGRLFKRLIDERIDVSGAEDSLLTHGFDIKAWIQRGAVSAQPSPQRPPDSPPRGGKAGLRRGGTIHISEGLIAAMEEPDVQAPALDGVTVAPVFGAAPTMAGVAPPIGAQAVSPAEGYLRVEAGAYAGQQLGFGEVTIIGSQSGVCDLVFSESGVSARHLELRRFGDRVGIRDLGSDQGSIHYSAQGGDPILIGDKAVPLHPGDRLRLGAQLVLVYERMARGDS
jgi:nitrite reductase (NADH) large subunit